MAISMATANHGGMGLRAALGVLAMPDVTTFPQLREGRSATGRKEKPALVGQLTGDDRHHVRFEVATPSAAVLQDVASAQAEPLHGFP